MKTIVIALGGNAILKKGEKPEIKYQINNIHRACHGLFEIIKNNRVVLTHGNGPQSGYLMIQQKAPLDVIDAETEGQIGYLMQIELFNLFKSHKVKRQVVTILTQVLVDRKDKAFKNKDKFVGPFYTKKEADKMKKQFRIKEDIGRGYRRVVASPKPKKIIESNIIKKIVKNGKVVIAAGGGGIPVVKKGKNIVGIEAVIDKDLASAKLGNEIHADELIIITDVSNAYLNYKMQNQLKLKDVTLKDIKKHYQEGHFASGSMGPKIEAAINFLENGGKKVIITDIPNIRKGGTIITK